MKKKETPKKCWACKEPRVSPEILWCEKHLKDRSDIKPKHDRCMIKIYDKI